MTAFFVLKVPLAFDHFFENVKDIKFSKNQFLNPTTNQLNRSILKFKKVCGMQS